MTRQEAMQSIEAIVQEFGADAAKNWLAESITARAVHYRRAGLNTKASILMRAANGIAAVQIPTL